MPTYSKLKSTNTNKGGRIRTIAISSLFAVVILTAAITATVLAVTDTNPRRDPPGEEVSTAIVFGMPVADFTSILKNSSLTELQWNETMRRWEGHKGVTIEVPVGTAVVATFAGTITSVQNHALHGRQVTIEHRDGLVTVLSNLDRNTTVSEGQRVEKGQQVGYVGQTRFIEFPDTSHLHIGVYRHGSRIDPNDFIDFPAK